MTIRIVGRKSSAKWIEEACSEYGKRLRGGGGGGGGIDCSTEWYKTNDALVKAVSGDYDKSRSVVLLDPTDGRQCTSEEFAGKFFSWMELGGSRVTFVVGGGASAGYI